MTSLDHRLDPNLILTPEQLILYRLARTRYANLSGVGAAAFPGRWNRPGEPAIYTSIEQSTPVLELLAHTPKDTIPSNLSMMKISLFGWPKQSTEVSVIDSLRAATTTTVWSESEDHPFAIAVPSVILPVWNVVLYPSAKGFWQHVSLASIEPFTFDPRLFPKGTLAESAT